jgi:hypothetical protein
VLTYRRVEQVIDEYGLTPPECEGDQCRRWSFQAVLSPVHYKMEKRDVFGINLDLEF